MLERSTNKRAGSTSARSIAATIAARAIAVSVTPDNVAAVACARVAGDARASVACLSKLARKKLLFVSQNCVSRFVYKLRNSTSYDDTSCLLTELVRIAGRASFRVSFSSSLTRARARADDAYWYSSRRVRRVEKIALQGWALQSPARSHETNYRATGGGATCILRSRTRVPVKLVCAKCTEFTMYKSLTKYSVVWTCKEYSSKQRIRIPKYA